MAFTTIKKSIDDGYPETIVLKGMKFYVTSLTLHDESVVNQIGSDMDENFIVSIRGPQRMHVQLEAVSTGEVAAEEVVKLKEASTALKKYKRLIEL